MNELEQKIVNSTENATFFEVLYEEYRKHISNNDELIKTLAQLHNQEKINIISEFSLLKSENSSSNSFRMHHILAKSLSFLNAPIEEVKNCIKHLTLSAGNSTASYDLILPFIEFCSKDINRSDDLLEQELLVIDVDFDHISTALIGGYSIDKATYFYKSIGLLKHENLIIIQRAISALSRFDYTEEPGLATVATKKIITCTRTIKDEQILSTAINTLITLLANYEEIEPDVIEFIEHNVGNNSPEFIFRIAQQLNYRHESLSEEIQQLLFKSFKNLDTKYIGVIEQIDWYVYKKISSSDALDVSKILEYLIDNNDSFQIDMLSHSLQEIQTQEFEEMLSVIFTKWLIKRESAYCISAFNLVKTATTDQIKIEFDKNQVKKEDLVYLVNKSIGWLSFQPSAALSLIISIVPMCSESEIQLMENKTFEFIALNYPSQTKAFLQEYSDSSEKNVVKFSDNLIQKLESFLEEFNKIHEIQEIRPSTRQRNEYANYQQNLFSEAMAKPLEGSLVDMFFPNKKVTLYGNKFIHKHKDFSGNTIRQVMPFSKMSHSIDFPSLANLTPHTQEYFLKLLRVEELVNETNS